MRRVRDFQRETTDEAKPRASTRREDGGFEQWVIGLEMKDPVIGAKIVELAEVEKILRRIYQVEVKGLLAAEKRVLHAEKTKMETTKQYMQEVLFLREKSRSGVPFDVLEGLDHLSEEDTRMFFDAGISLPPGVRQVLDLIIQEKVNDAADRLQKKLLRGELDGLQGSSLRSTRTKGFRTESESETEKVAVKLRDDSPDLRDQNFPTACKECADLKAERDQLVTTVNQLQKQNRKLESEKHTVAEEVCRLRLELQDTVDVIDAEKKQIADRYEAEMDQIQKEKFLLEEALREMKQGAQGFQSARLNELETLVEKLENEIKSLKEGESNGYALRAQIGEQKAIVAAQKLEIGTLTDELAKYRNAEKELHQKLEQADRTLFATQKQLLKALGQGDDAGDGGQSNTFANSMAAELMARIAEDSMQVHDRLYVDAYKRRERQRLLWEERAPQIETKWLEAQAVLRDEFLGDLLWRKGGPKSQLVRISTDSGAAMEDPVTKALIIIGRFLFGGTNINSGASPVKNLSRAGFAPLGMNSTKSGAESGNLQPPSHSIHMSGTATRLPRMSKREGLPANGIQGEGYWLY